MREMEDFTSTALDLPNNLVTTFRGLQQQYERVRDNQVAAFRTSQEKYANLEEDILQSLLRSNRYLKRFFESDANKVSFDSGP